MRVTARIRSADCGHHARLVATLGQNLGHAHQSQLLAVALGALTGMFPAAFDKVDDLVCLDLGNHLGLHRRTRNKRRPQRQRITTDHQNFVELDLVSSRSRQFFHAQHIARLNLVLFAAGFENREHWSYPSLFRILWPRHLTGVLICLGQRAHVSERLFQN